MAMTETIKSDYGNKAIAWLGRNGYDSMYNSFFQRSDVDDKTKKEVAWMIYHKHHSNNGAVAQPKNEGDDMVHLVPYEEADGSFYYHNRENGKVEVIVRKLPNGLFSYYGPKKYMEMLGGRGSLSGIVDRMADGKYFNKN